MITIVQVVGEKIWPPPEAARLSALRLVAAVSTVVLDLTQVTFLGAAGLRVLVRAALRAEHHRIRLCLVTGSAPGRANLTERFECYSRREDAFAGRRQP